MTFRKSADNSRQISVNQVITESELVERSNKLESVLANGNFVDFCRQKADETSDQHNRYVWHFLKANFEQDPRSEMLNLLGKQEIIIFPLTFLHFDLFNTCHFLKLGYNTQDINEKFSRIIEKQHGNDVKLITNKLGHLGRVSQLNTMCLISNR